MTIVEHNLKTLQWFLDGTLILDNKEKIGTARPITTLDGIVTGYEFIPVKNNTLAIKAKSYLELRHMIVSRVNKIRNLNYDSKAMQDCVETIHKVKL